MLAEALDEIDNSTEPFFLSRANSKWRAATWYEERRDQQRYGGNRVNINIGDNVPTMVGGYGYEGVRSFYSNHLVGKFFPPDVKMQRVSLTAGKSQITEELIISFTHTTIIDWMLPAIQPTGKKVEVGFVVIVGIKGEKITHEHIYWDQACVLVQIGLLDPTGLPVCGVESARRISDPSLPTRTEF